MRRSQELQDFLAAANGGQIQMLVRLLDAADRADMEKLAIAPDVDTMRKLQGRIAGRRDLRTAIQPTTRVVAPAENPYSS